MDYEFRSVRPDFPSPEEWRKRVDEMYENRWFSNFGPKAKQLEQRLALLFGGADTTCVTSACGTAGLAAALIACNDSRQVLLPAFTFAASLAAVRMSGASPLILDVDPETWIPSLARLKHALTKTHAKAVMLVAPFGIQRDFGPYIELCRSHGATLILDNAAGLGPKRTAVESSPDVLEIFSMHATKPFCVGEGGVIFAHSSRERSLRSALNFALHEPGVGSNPSWGINGKLSELHACVGLAQIERISRLVRVRQLRAQSYGDLLSSDKVSFVRDYKASPWQTFPILFRDSDTADRFIDTAADRKVEIRKYYRPSLSRWPEAECFEACPEAESLSERMCVLPIYSDASDTEWELVRSRVAESLKIAVSETLLPGST